MRFPSSEVLRFLSPCGHQTPGGSQHQAPATGGDKHLGSVPRHGLWGHLVFSAALQLPSQGPPHP